MSHPDSLARRPIDPTMGNSFGSYSEPGTVATPELRRRRGEGVGSHTHIASFFVLYGPYVRVSHMAVSKIYTWAQITLGSSRQVSTRLDMSSESRRACRAVLFAHGGRRTSYSARMYKFSRFYALTYTNPISSTHHTFIV